MAQFTSLSLACIKLDCIKKFRFILSQANIKPEWYNWSCLFALQQDLMMEQNVISVELDVSLNINFAPDEDCRSSLMSTAIAAAMWALNRTYAALPGSKRIPAALRIHCETVS